MAGKLDTGRLKVNLRLAGSRISTLQKRLTASSTQAHREVADLLKDGKDERARLRVKHVIRDDFTSEALEMLCSYAEDLAKSVNLMAEAGRQCDPDLLTPLVSLIYASTRVEVPELMVVRDILLDQYGKRFYEENVTQALDKRLEVKLSMKNPAESLIEQYLMAIAGNFNLDYKPRGAQEEPTATKTIHEPPSYESLMNSPLLSAVPSSPALIEIPPSPSNLQHLPVNYREQRATSSSEALGQMPDFDDLAKRFAALKQQKKQ